MSVVRDPSTRSDSDWRPLAIRTSESATQGVYGLILATAVIAISRESDPSDAGQAALSMLVTALVFWLAHVYARLLGTAVSDDRGLTRAAVARAARENWSLVEVVIPLVLILALGAIGVIPERVQWVTGVWPFGACRWWISRQAGRSPTERRRADLPSGARTPTRLFAGRCVTTPPRRQIGLPKPNPRLACSAGTA
jgi:hypothetical protein